MAVSRFTNGTPLNFELIAAEVSGELPYTVGYERSSVSFNGSPAEHPPRHPHLPPRARRLETRSPPRRPPPRSIRARPPRRRRNRRHGQPDQLQVDHLHINSTPEIR